ncbi:MAG: hypothetical protein Q9187_004568, partial [Circinaria calcarea]
LIFRAHYFQEATLPDPFHIFIVAPTRVGILRETHTDATLFDDEVSKREGGIQLGDWWECRIKEIDLYTRRLVMHPVRLVARLEEEAVFDTKKSNGEWGLLV